MYIYVYIYIYICIYIYMYIFSAPSFRCYLLLYEQALVSLKLKTIDAEVC